MSAPVVAQLTAYGQSLVASLQEGIRTQKVGRFGPVNASGRLAASLRVEVLESPTGYTLLLYAASYALALEYGRKPGAFPPLLAIQAWIEDKGLVPHPDAQGRSPSTVAGPKGYSSLAYLIGRKIAGSGTTLYQAGAPSGLFGSRIGPNLVAAELARLLLPAFTTGLTSALRAAA